MTPEILEMADKELGERLKWYFETSSNHEKVLIAVQVRQLHLLGEMVRLLDVKPGVKK